jgi:uncharacterized membrane protein
MQEHFKWALKFPVKKRRVPGGSLTSAGGNLRMKRTPVKLMAAGALLLYPIAIYFADDYLSPSLLMAGLLLLVAARLLVAAWISPVKRFWGIALAVLLLAAAIATPLLLPDIKLVYLRLYPALFSLLAFAFFFGSLFTRMPLVERFARLEYRDLPAKGVVYTRYVTWAWSGVLLCNALVSLYTSIGTSFKIWSLYNGVIVYFVFGGAFACEYMIRMHMRRKWTAA